jgi:hypothetical protein
MRARRYIIMFYGKAVKYTENGKEFDGIVFHEHFGLESHQGENGEPLAHILFPDPAKEHLNLADPMAKMVVRHDVAHASHEFTDEEVKKYGEVFAGGRYHESRSPLEVLKEVADRKEARFAAAKKAKEEEGAAKTAPAKDPIPEGGNGTVN